MTEDETGRWYHRLNGPKLQEIVKDRKAWHAAVPGVAELDISQQLNASMCYINYI